jgi:hypothetical protein
MENRAVGADGNAMTAGNTLLVSALAEYRVSLSIRLEKSKGAYCVTYAVTPTGAVIDCYQAHVFLLL